MSTYLKSFTENGVYRLYLYDENGEPIRRVSFGLDLLEVIKSGVKSLDEDNNIIERHKITNENRSLYLARAKQQCLIIEEEMKKELIKFD